jgi:hypothetical protein
MSILGFQNLYQGDGSNGGDCPTITLGDLTEPYALVGEAFSDTVAPSGGSSPYNLSITVGSLPNGLSLNTSTGAITGTPTTFESQTFTIGGNDADGCSVTPKEFTIDVEYADVIDFVARTQSDGSDITGALLTKYNDFMGDIWSIRSKIIRLNLFQADTFTGIFTPLLLGYDVNNPVGNSTDTNNNFVSGDWSATGLTGNGTTKYLNTGVVFSTQFTQNNIALGIYTDNVNSLITKDIGAESGATYAYVGCYWVAVGGSFATLNDNVNDYVTPAAGLIGASRTASNAKLLYSGGNNTSVTTVSVGTIPYAGYVFASNNSGSAAFPSSREHKAYFMGKDFGLSDFQTLETAIANFYS